VSKYTLDDVAEALYPHWPKYEDGSIDTRQCWANADIQKGWADPLIYGIRIGVDVDPHFVVHQVKEKFGGLRFYATLPHETETMIESLVINICEQCGEVGTLSMTDGKYPWYKTLCEDCRGDKYIDKWAWDVKYGSEE